MSGINFKNTSKEQKKNDEANVTKSDWLLNVCGGVSPLHYALHIYLKFFIFFFNEPAKCDVRNFLNAKGFSGMAFSPLSFFWARQIWSSQC